MRASQAADRVGNPAPGNPGEPRVESTFRPKRIPSCARRSASIGRGCPSTHVFNPDCRRCLVGERFDAFRHQNKIAFIALLLGEIDRIINQVSVLRGSLDRRRDEVTARPGAGGLTGDVGFLRREVNLPCPLRRQNRVPSPASTWWSDGSPVHRWHGLFRPAAEIHPCLGWQAPHCPRRRGHPQILRHPIAAMG